ncbi:hypothetical protein V498_02498 [Pseudogymnoascus sp. VKM F-4517 (FW-2822)]|nr:hypothetical protein V498_02498 [Pseudogymnoascus sp. VKM F-4517 (FW-2822)]
MQRHVPHDKQRQDRQRHVPETDTSGVCIRGLDHGARVAGSAAWVGWSEALPKVRDRAALEEQEEEEEDGEDELDDGEGAEDEDLVAGDGDAEEEDADGELD